MITPLHDHDRLTFTMSIRGGSLHTKLAGATRTLRDVVSCFPQSRGQLKSFDGTVKRVTADKRVMIGRSTVEANIGIGPNDNGFSLTVARPNGNTYVI